jgi:hypothetical protein
MTIEKEFAYILAALWVGVLYGYAWGRSSKARRGAMSGETE